MSTPLLKVQDPNAILTWTFDWAAELAANGNATITGATVVTDVAGATVTAQANTTTTVTCKLACPTVPLGTLVALTAHVTLSTAEQDFKTHHITIEHT